MTRRIFWTVATVVAWAHHEATQLPAKVRTRVGEWAYPGAQPEDRTEIEHRRLLAEEAAKGALPSVEGSTPLHPSRRQGHQS